MGRRRVEAECQVVVEVVARAEQNHGQYGANGPATIVVAVRVVIIGRSVIGRSMEARAIAVVRRARPGRSWARRLDLRPAGSRPRRLDRWAAGARSHGLYLRITGRARLHGLRADWTRHAILRGQ